MSSDGTTGTSSSGTFAPGPSRLRRLTSFEYQSSVVALLGPGTQVTTELEKDPVLNNLTAIGAAQISFSQPLTEQFERSAMALAESLAKDPARRQQVVGCAPAGAADESCLRSFITSFGRRIFRRPLTAEEVDLYAGVGKNAMTTLSDFWGGVQYTLAGLLQSPSFLYRTELGTANPSSPAKRALGGYELASRLSFLLWSTTPDDQLLDAAGAGSLATPDGLKQQTDRLLAAPRAQDSIVRIFSEMLSLSRLDDLSQLPAIYPAAASDTLGASLRTETQNVLRDIVFTRNADYRELFTTTQTSLNGELAALYGVSGPTGTSFVPVTFPANGPRAGYLTQGSFLALNAKPDNTSPTHRGKFIIETLLCNALPPPPNDVVTVLADKDKSKTMREQLQIHQQNTTCAGCHKEMDPMGLALEHFDGLGAYRETDRGMALDVTGTYAGVSFNGAKELGKALAEAVKTAEGNPEVTDCVMRNLFRAATGHLETTREQPAIVKLSTAFSGNGYHVRGALSELIASEGFRFVGEPE
jgi:hypothetical protein